jgi:hypothetical protein
MLKKEKPMMSVTAIIQGAQAQHSWNRGTENRVVNVRAGVCLEFLGFFGVF